MKTFKLLLLTIGVCFITLAFLPAESYGIILSDGIEQAVSINDTVIEKISFFDRLKELNWGNVILLLFTGGMFGAIRNMVKEGKDVKVKYKKYKADGVLDQAEKDDLLKELGEFILAIDSVWMILKKVFNTAKRKKK